MDILNSVFEKIEAEMTSPEKRQIAKRGAEIAGSAYGKMIAALTNSNKAKSDIISELRETVAKQQREMLQLRPEVLESERAMNDQLTREVERLEALLAMCKK